MRDGYAYRARDRHGALIAGQLRSPDREGVLRYLDGQGLILMPGLCTRCHDDVGEDLTKHVAHSPAKTSCTECHNPHLAYGQN